MILAGLSAVPPLLQKGRDERERRASTRGRDPMESLLASVT